MEKGVDAGVVCLVNNYMKGKEYKSRKYSKKNLDVFFFKFEDKNISEVKTREVFKNKIKEIHYPFYENKQKYRFINAFIFENVSPLDIKGVGKAVGRGLGFTKDLSPVVKELEKYSVINKIIVSKEKSTGIKRNVITFNIQDLENFFKILKPFNDKQSKEKRKITNNLLSEVLPLKFKKDDSKYIKGDLTEFIVNKDLKNSNISEGDLKNLTDILPDEIKEQQVVYKIEEKIELIKIKSTKKEFEKLKLQKNDSGPLEKKWHKFFKKNDWIFSHVLLLPVCIYGDEIYVGGKNVQNKDGKVADFLYRNSLTNSACIIEIKTHKSKICNKGKYRGTNVFSLNGGFTGAINQVLVQKDKLLKEYSSLLNQEKEAGKADVFFEVFNPKSILIIGSISDLSKKQRNNFEIFRNSFGGLEIITFDEVEEKIKYFLDLLEISKK